MIKCEECGNRLNVEEINVCSDCETCQDCLGFTGVGGYCNCNEDLEQGAVDCSLDPATI